MVNIITESNTTALDLLLEKVYRDRRHDFRGYKRGTVTRRLERRLRATGVKTYLEYMRFLDTHPEEYERLADDRTIKVSGFIRSPYTFQQVVKLVLPEVDSNLRQMVNFSYFDLVSTKTPPFMNLDCIFCCNILIYLQRHSGKTRRRYPGRE